MVDYMMIGERYAEPMRRPYRVIESRGCYRAQRKDCAWGSWSTCGPDFSSYEEASKWIEAQRAQEWRVVGREVA